MIKLIFLLVILFLALSYFGISIEQIVNSPAGQANLAYLAHLISLGWQWLTNYVSTLKSS